MVIIQIFKLCLIITFLNYPKFELIRKEEKDDNSSLGQKNTDYNHIFESIEESKFIPAMNL